MARAILEPYLKLLVMSKGKLQGRVALVTGAGRGIGRAIAVAYAREGAKVAATARTVAEVQGLIDQIHGEGGEARGFPADLLDAPVPAELVRKTADAFGGIDILVNNAGIGSSAGPRPVVNF